MSVNTTGVVCTGNELKSKGDSTVMRVGGHFAGSCVLHWPHGSAGKGSLFSGDTIQVVPDKRSSSSQHVSSHVHESHASHTVYLCEAGRGCVACPGERGGGGARGDCDVARSCGREGREGQGLRFSRRGGGRKGKRVLREWGAAGRRGSQIGNA